MKQFAFSRIAFVIFSQLLLVSSAFAQRGLTQLPDPDPKKELASFKVAKGFKVNLFACEPMVTNPIQMNWDTQGRLWVATSETYPHIKPGQIPNDKIVILEDTDHDGVADKQTVFADGLLMPTAILPGDGGVYVGAATELLHLKDTDGDGKADKKTVILSGFGTEDTHHVIHTFRRGPDGRIYINQSIYTHSHIETPRGVRRLLAGGTWRFDPRTLELEVFSRGLVNPWGHVFDAWGQSFETDGAGSHGIHYVFPDAVMRTAYNAARYIEGMNPGQPKHCGLELISNHDFPNGWNGRFLTNDFRGNRINSFELAESGSGYVSVQKDHLLTSNYISFRPIDTLMGPDSAIYIADWYNPIIQHGEVDFRDDRRDHEHGRIWRITPENWEKPVMHMPASRTIEQLLKMLSNAEVTEKWWTDTARFELTSRDQKQVIPAVKKWFDARTQAKKNTTQDRLQTLWVLQRWNQTDQSILKAALTDKDHRSRAAAVRIVKDFLEESFAIDFLTIAIRDSHPQVRLETLHVLRKLGTPAAIQLAAEAVSDQNDRFLDFSTWQTFRQTEEIWLPEVQKNPQWLSKKTEVLLFAAKSAKSSQVVSPVLKLWQQGKFSEEQSPAVLAFIGERGEAKHLDVLWNRVVGNKNSAAIISDSEKETLLNSLANTAKKRRIVPSVSLEKINQLLQSENNGIRLTASKLAGLWKVKSSGTELKKLIEGNKQPGNIRTESLRSLALLGGKENQQFLISIANGKQLPNLRVTAIDSLAGKNMNLAAKSAVTLLENPTKNLNVDSVLNPFLSRRNGPNALTASLKQVTLSAEVASVGVRRALSLTQKNPALVTAFQKAGNLKPVKKEMTAAELKQFAGDVIKQGNIHRGEKIYRREKLLCIKCHAIGGAGGKVGPDLSSIGASAPVDYLIDSLILPSKKIKEGYHTIQVVTVDGLVKAGVPVLQNQQETHLRDANGKIEIIPADDIDFSKNVPVSLMPADLTSKLRRDELIDLVRFLSALGKTGELVVSKKRYVRTWQIIVPGDNIKAINDAIRHNGTGHSASDDPMIPWGTGYSHVDGKFATNDLAWMGYVEGKSLQFMRFEIEVVNQGDIGLKIEDPEFLMMWVDDKKTKVASQVKFNLPKGKHRITIVAESKKRTYGPVRIELIDIPNSTGQASLVN